MKTCNTCSVKKQNNSSSSPTIVQNTTALSLFSIYHPIKKCFSLWVSIKFEQSHMSWRDFILPAIKIFIDIIINHWHFHHHLQSTRKTFITPQGILVTLQRMSKPLLCVTHHQQHIWTYSMNFSSWWLPIHCKANFCDKLFIFVPLPVMDDKSAKDF